MRREVSFCLQRSRKNGLSVHLIHDNQDIGTFRRPLPQFSTLPLLGRTHLHKSRSNDYSARTLGDFHPAKHVQSHSRTLRIRIVRIVQNGKSALSAKTQAMLHALNLKDSLLPVSRIHSQIFAYHKRGA